MVFRMPFLSFIRTASRIPSILKGSVERGISLLYLVEVCRPAETMDKGAQP